ncbi:MAG: tetratricopeptide repeat protein [Candidatus Eisenbacteria bacterium]
MKSRVLAAGVAAVLCVVVAGTALARNPHCAGGIQYVTQGLRDKEKGNTEDYQREMNKAVDQLSMCATEDDTDFEALGYLGWAYAELDSCGPAGEWFAKAIAAGTAKGDRKKVELIATNRDHYWTMRYNEGIAAIQTAQSAYPDFTKAPTEDEKELYAQARQSYDLAVTKLTQAKFLRPGHSQTLRNLATAFALMGNFDSAEAVLRNAIVEVPGDTNLTSALTTVRANKANGLLQANKLDEAIAYYGDLVKQDPNGTDLYMGLGNAYFTRAGNKTDAAAKKADYKLAGDAYAKAYSLRDTDANLAFNAALAYQNASELALAEAQWRAVLVKSPNDPDALSQLGSVLADEKKFADAEQVLAKAISIKPEEKVYYRQLAAVYSKQNNNARMTEMMFVYLALNSGTPAADAAATAKGAKAGSAAANTVASLGAPEKVMTWTDNTAGTLQTWIYTGKKQAFTFNAAGVLVQKSDWSFGKK